MPESNDTLKRCLDNIQTITVLTVMCLLIWFIWISKNDNGIENLEFWFSLSMVFVFLMDALFTLKRGHGWAKGGKIDKVRTPNLFWFNLTFSFFVAALGSVGVFYYW
jgi:hypothetical protein